MIVVPPPCFRSAAVLLFCVVSCCAVCVCVCVCVCLVLCLVLLCCTCVLSLSLSLSLSLCAPMHIQREREGGVGGKERRWEGDTFRCNFGRYFLL